MDLMLMIKFMVDGVGLIMSMLSHTSQTPIVQLTVQKYIGLMLCCSLNFWISVVMPTLLDLGIWFACG